MIPEGTPVWGIMVAMAIGTFLIRFSFLGILGSSNMPPWVLRHLRYTAVAVLPALVAPLILWPAATGGQTDPARLAAGAVTLVVGLLTKSAMWAIVAGASALAIGLRLGV